jgi:ABC-type amino acid transport substrate-binding protein
MQMVGAPFRKEAYGIVFPRNDPLRKQPNIALCALREAAIYQPLSDKWLAAK